MIMVCNLQSGLSGGYGTKSIIGQYNKKINSKWIIQV
jgi:hypothetical protein